MVPIENLYQIRNLLLASATEGSNGDIFKTAFLNYLGLREDSTNVDSDKAYMRCALAGIERGNCKSDDLTRVLGQSAFLEGTPMPWVSDIWAVLGIKLAAYNSKDENIVSQFHGWVNEFLPQRIKDGRLSSKEQGLAEYILNNELTINSASCVLLFLHYKEILPINTAYFHDIVESFMDEFKYAYKDTNLSPILQALYVFVFDKINSELAAVPPKKWDTSDIVQYLENLHSGLKKWTWEDKAKTKGGNAEKWHVENEYHVQNLLYVLLASVFPGIQDEVYTAPIGQKTARIDLRIPSIKTIIEVKYRKDQKKSFQDLIGEVAEDRGLYRSDDRFKDNTFICFLWDNTMSTQEHAKFKEGVMSIDGIDGCVVISAPSVMNQSSSA